MRETYEVEVKIPIDDSENVIKRILENRGKELNAETQSDIYFDHPCRSFAETDESVRVRQRIPSDGTKGLAEITYKGPKVDRTTKTRLEYTSEVNDIDATLSILEHTGFTHVAKITKHRVFYVVDDITISVDEVEQVGLYIEFELLAESNSDLERSRERIFELINQLGLDSSNTIRASYLELFLRRIRP